MHQVRLGYNAKARGSIAGGKKKGKRKKQTSSVSPESVDPNAVIHIPKSLAEKELEKREQLKQELEMQSESKMDSKKKKRLFKYIEKKLKKEGRIALFEKLSQSQAELPTTLHLQSSATLGTGKVSTNRERLEKLEDKETRRAIEGRVGKRKRTADKFDILHTVADDDGDEDFRSDENLEEMYDVSKRDVAEASVIPTVTRPEASVGSAIQRNPDGTLVAPRVAPKRNKKDAFARWNTKTDNSIKISDLASDQSFDSSDSENDSNDSNAKDDTEDGDGFEGSPSESQDEHMSPPPPPPKRKTLGFKDWANKQLGIAKGYAQPSDSNDADHTPSNALHPPPTKKRKTHHPSEPLEMRGPLGEDLQLPLTSLTQHLQHSGKSKAVTVARPADVHESRLLLPIVAEEQPIMEAVLLNHVVIICGETGSGKTTQVPQFLYEAGFGNPSGENPGMIGVTQPRRVAAMAMAHRVGHELSLTSSRVSYQIRYDATISSNTSIKFMTDGVLLRELATDFLLNKYSVIIIDEAHERSMNTDILIGVLSRVIRLREALWKEGKPGAKPLRLIIMSATLRVSDFAENPKLFSSPPPVINVAARQHPVTVHFNRRTPSDYVGEAIKKASKIHCRLPPGGILIFLTGQNEITGVCRKLEFKFGAKLIAERKERRRYSQQQPEADEKIDEKGMGVSSAQADVEAEDIYLGVEDSELAFDIDENADLEDPDALDSDDEQQEENDGLGIDTWETETPMHIVPLYSLLPSERQMRVFQPPPPDHRLVVVSTNIAETSLTIPGIRYVIDCGRSKERRYDIANGIQAFQVSWISKASAAQRSGRAGRTGPGHCYRLYSSALFEHHFESFSQPELLRMPIEGVVLQMKSIHIDAVINFPFPTPPDQHALTKAEKILTHLGALNVSPVVKKGSNEVITTGTMGGRITDLGKAMSYFPVSPRFSRMLVGSRQHGCLPYVISIVSALSVGDPFLREDGINEDGERSEDEDTLSHLHSAALKVKEGRKIRRKAFFESQQVHASLGNSTSDLFSLLSVVGAYEYAGGGHKFCSDHFVRPKAMEEIHKLRYQISAIVQTNFTVADTGFEPHTKPPSDLQLKVLRQLIAAAFIDQVALRKDLVEKRSNSGNKYSTAKDVEYRAVGIAESVYIHPSSVIANGPPPDYIVYHEVVRTSRVWLKGVTAINQAWLSSLGKPSLCTFSRPTKNSAGKEVTIPYFGPDRWELPAIKVDSM